MVNNIVAFFLGLAASCAALPLNLLPHHDSHEPLDVFLIPHSHDDVGWLKTIEGYYEEEVRHIYNNVVEQLQHDVTRKFSIVEMAFFSRWWDEATPEQRELVFQYLANDQIEFVLGGWCMNDDAGPSQAGLIDQISTGHKFIKETFGVIPRYGWAIDPFGTSSEVATLWAQFGFHAHVINRIDYRLKDELKANQGMEFVWRGSPSLGEEQEIFTHILDSHYSFPRGYDFENAWEVDPIGDEEDLATRAEALVEELKLRSTWFKTNKLLVPGGDDFKWQNAKIQFDNWDRLISYINARTAEHGIHIKYATLGEYFRALNEVEDVEWPVFTGDFFPYADNENSYWTGYFTTHSVLKKLIRTAESVLRSLEVLGMSTAIVNPQSMSSESDLGGLPAEYRQLLESVAEVQHHDGVTGTSKDFVIEDYHNHLTDGIEEGEAAISSILEELTGSSNVRVVLADGEIALEDGEEVNVLFTNSLGWDYDGVPKVSVRTCAACSLMVMSAEGEIVPSQLNFESMTSGALPVTASLYARVSLPAVGYRVYRVRATTEETTIASRPVNARVLKDSESFETSNNMFSMTLDREENGQVKLSLFDGVTTTDLIDELMQYDSWKGDGQPSGAYIFRPEGDAYPVASARVLAEVVHGPLMTELRLTHDATHTQTLRVFRDPVARSQAIELPIEMSFAVGPLEPDEEVVVRLTTNLEDAELYTDDNGIEMKKRRHPDGPISSNYYPLVARAFLTEESTDANRRQLSIISTQTHGIGTLARGQVEVMLHRRCSRDDWRGMGEGLDDTTVATPTLYLLPGRADVVDSVRPFLTFRAQNVPDVYLTSEIARESFSAVVGSLPPSLHLIQLRPLGSTWNEATVSFQHIYTVEDGDMSEVAHLDIENWFIRPAAVSEEMLLNGLVSVKDAPRMSWKTAEASITPSAGDEPNTGDHVVFHPQQLKTYNVKFA